MVWEPSTVFCGEGVQTEAGEDAWRRLLVQKNIYWTEAEACRYLAQRLISFDRHDTLNHRRSSSSRVQIQTEWILDSWTKQEAVTMCKMPHWSRVSSASSRFTAERPLEQRVWITVQNWSEKTKTTEISCFWLSRLRATAALRRRVTQPAGEETLHIP